MPQHERILPGVLVIVRADAFDLKTERTVALPGDPARSLRWLDAYEGCGEDDAEPHAYQRVITSVFLKCGQTIDAWIYYYRWPLGEARLLWDGRFAAPKSLPLFDF